MADNVETNPGSGGAVFATDDIGGVNFPRTKMALGADGVNDGDVSATNPMPVSLPAAQIAALAPLATQAVSGTVALDAGSLAALETISVVNLPTLGQTAMAASLPVVIAGNQSAIQTVEPALLITGAAAQTAVVNNIIDAASGANATDVANYRSMTVQVVSTGTAGTFIFEQSNNDVNFSPLPVYNSALTTGVPITAAITATASAIVYSIPVRGRFIRLRIVTTITGGSIQSFSKISTEPWTPSVFTVAQPVAASLLATVSGTVTATVGTSITGGTISPLTVAGVSIEASSAKTVTGVGATITNASGRGAIFFLNVSAVAGTAPTLDVRVQVQDPVSATWFDVPGAAFIQRTAISTALLCVSPDVVEAANSKVSYPIPRTYRLAWTIGGTTPSFTFSVGAQYII